MAYEIPGLVISLPAGGNLASSQYKFVKLNSSGQVVDIAANTDIPCGILQNAPASGDMATVMVSGVSKVQGDVDLAKANLIGPSADGQAASYANGTDTTKYICGQVIDDNTTAGGLATVLFNCSVPNRGA